MAANGANDQSDVRRRYVDAWNDTMITMWQEQITLLGVIDTGALLGSLKDLPVTEANEEYTTFSTHQEFLTYGIWQDLGVGREVARADSEHAYRYREYEEKTGRYTGKLLKEKIRDRRPWFSRKFYQSVMAIKEFLAESVGIEFIDLMTEALSEDTIRSIT